MTDRLYELPSDDAPISEWLKPISALMHNKRADLYSGVEVGANMPNGAAVHVHRRMKEKMRARRARESSKATP